MIMDLVQKAIYNRQSYIESATIKYNELLHE